MEYKWEFHGTLVPPNEIWLSSMEFHSIFHGIAWNFGVAKLKITKFHGIPLNIPWNSMELWCRQVNYHLVPWNSMELWDCHFIQYHVTLDFHGIFHGIPWNSGVAKYKRHWVPNESMELDGRHFKWHRCSMEFHGIFHGIPWYSDAAKWNITSSMEFHRTLRLSLYWIPCYPGLPWDIPWSSMERWSSQIIKSPSSMGFHGIRRAPFQMAQVLHGIPWTIPWNSIEIWCRQMKYHLVPWNF